jgi:hypothetical protein
MFVVRPVTAVLLGYRNYRLGSYRTVIDPGAALVARFSQIEG